jgi:hypothetical protein
MVEPDRFPPLFERRARTVRGGLLARRVLTGLAVGLAVAVLAAGAAWWARRGALRPWCALLGVAGAAAGALLAGRRRWSDVDVALWLDDRLATGETITTAVELRSRAEDDGDARAVVVSKAAEALARSDADRVRPGVLRPVHVLAPLAIAALVVVARSPLPPAPVVNCAPGTDAVQLAPVGGLNKVAQLGQAHARDDAQRERLEKIARDARALRADLEKGLARREALDRMAALRDAIAAERLSLGDGERRAGLEAAVSRLRQIDATRNAAEALGDHDLERMDREIARIANGRDERAREEARSALEDAAAAARAAGAPDVGQALEEEKRALEAREKRAEALRRLETAMEGAGVAREDPTAQAEALDREGSDEAARKLASAMSKALEKLTPEERKKLSDRMKDAARKRGAPGGPQDLMDLADRLSTPDGQKDLEDELKDFADQDDQPPEAQQQRQLDDAQQGADDAQGQIDGQKPGQGPSGRLTALPAPGGGRSHANGDGSGGPGNYHDTGTGPHVGTTGEAAGAGTLRGRAHAPMNRAPGMPGRTTRWTDGNAGGTANVRGTGALGSVGPSQIDGVDHSDVPEEYREQVRQYFQP